MIPVENATDFQDKYAMTYDCNAGAANMKFGWSGAKKSWCCAVKHIGCGGHYHYYGGPRYGGGPHYGDGPHYGGGPHYGTYHDAFDCSAGYAMRHNGWSHAKKSWCCVHKGVDCWHPHHTSQAYDCAAGYGNCWAGWSDSKKLWCSKYKGVHCKPQKRFNCDDPDVYWSSRRQQWCFDKNGHVYCNADRSKMPVRWSHDKRAYCCHTEGKGCHGHHHHLRPYNCKSGGDMNSWPITKKMWCARNFYSSSPPSSSRSLATLSICLAFGVLASRPSE